MGYEVRGRLHHIFDTKEVGQRGFQKRDFVVELSDDPRYPQYIQFELTGDRCGQVDDFGVGDDVRVEFDLRGREWTSPKGEVRYFNSLTVWQVDRQGAAPSGEEPPLPDGPPPGFSEDDTPF